jgi:predicted RND superfamily exporter protein
MKMDPSTAPLDFDPKAGSRLENLIFNNRMAVVVASFVVTILFAVSALHIRLNANFESVIPAHQQMILNYLQNKQNLEGFGNTVDVIVQADSGTIMNKNYMMALQHINDELFLIPGVNRSFMRSLWTSNVRWSAVTDAGLAGGPVMPMDFNGSADSLATLQQNIERSGEIGTLVAPDFKSSLVEMPLLDRDYISGKPINYGALANRLDQIRNEYAKQGVTVRVVGFAMVEGEIIRALRAILGFFLISVVVTVAMVYWYTRCIRSTAVVMVCSLTAVIWLLGLLPALGFELDPYSILVPFLIFAIGISHGSQKMNGVIQDIGRGNSRLIAARLTFRRLFLAGLTAIICDAVGFAVLLLVDIKAIQDLAITASLGVVILVFTNLIFLPVLLSYIGVSTSAAVRSFREEKRANAGQDKHPIWEFLDRFTRRGWATFALLTALGLGGVGTWEARHLQIGDLDAGAPELRVHSQYNLDTAYFVRHYGASSDQFVIMVKTASQQCSQYSTLATMDALETTLRTVPGVGTASSVADFERNMAVQLNEGNYDWYDLVPNQALLNQVLFYAPATMVSSNCDFMTIVVSLKDHKAQTLSRVVDTVDSFLKFNPPKNATILMAAGNAGIEAATNIVVSHANDVMLLGVYAAVILLCFFNFRSWRAVLIAVLPLALTSVLAEALMVVLGIGVKVATLPVTALGVGIGVDYSLYILSITMVNLRAGMGLSEAYYRALLFTGKVVILTGLTLAVGVATWIFSPIKYQADMGELLAFMFIWNMLGAIVLLPALANLLLPDRVRSPMLEIRSKETMIGIHVK